MAAEIEALLSSWSGLATVGLMLATILAAIVYMLGAALLNDKMKTWAKMELAEVFYSAIIILMAFSLISLIDGIVNEALGVTGGASTTTVTKLKGPAGYFEDDVDICGPQLNNQEGYKDVTACHMRLGIYYMRTIFEEAQQLELAIILDYAWTSVASETSITVQAMSEKSGFVMWNPFRGFFSVRNTVMEMTANWNIVVMFLAKAQEVLIRFIAVAGFLILFVSGAVLRTFTFTRRLGGLLIGMAFALYYIYPAFYALGGLIMIELKDRARDDWIADTEANPDGSRDPPVINTIYINMSQDRKIGDITVLQSGATQKAELEKLNAMDASERADVSAGFIPVNAEGEQLDLGEKTTDDAEKDNIIVRMGKVIWDWVTYFATNNFIVDAGEWRPGGYIEVVSRLTFFSTFFALFGVLGTIAATRSLSATFGGDIELAGLTRLI